MGEDMGELGEGEQGKDRGTRWGRPGEGRREPDGGDMGEDMGELGDEDQGKSMGGGVSGGTERMGWGRHGGGHGGTRWGRPGEG